MVNLRQARAQENNEDEVEELKVDEQTVENFVDYIE